MSGPMTPAIIRATMLAEGGCLLYGMFSGPSPGINGRMPWLVMLAIAVIGVIAVVVL